ncbi:MAG: DUF58 domain-containing protein [Pirellulaceae bacterium]|nr:DUF58 domain-containing protein [Pirellulaceae bacterium]
MDTDTSAFSFEMLGITPWSVMFLAMGPLLVLMLATKTFPTSRLAIVFCIPVFMTIVLPVMPGWWWIVVGVIEGLLLIVTTIDLLSIASLKSLSVQRTMARVASLGGWHPVELALSYRGARSLRLQLTDDAANGLVIDPPLHRCLLAPHTRTTLSHRLLPSQRGEFTLEQVYLSLLSKLGLWQRLRTLPVPGILHVYPNIQQIGEYALLARTGRLSQIGVRKTRRAGQENNFERLRDYQEDDNYKHIDWRSTARRQKLTVKQFQADQSQRIIFLLDCGRMMTNQYQDLSLVDYSLNSILLLSYVALSQGDSVGMICFSDHVHNYVPPVGGKRQMNRLLHAGFNQFPRLVQSRFDNAFLYLSTHCRRRSLVVLVTNVIDQVNADQVQNYMGNLIGCHLPLLVLLRDHSLFQFADNPAPDESVLYRSAAASQLLLWRHQVIRRMQAGGCLALDVFPEEMTSPMVNKYLEIKAQHML